MDKETTRVVAMFIVAEIKKSYFNARKKKTDTTTSVRYLLKEVEIFDSGETYEVHIPYEIVYYHYGIKNVKFSDVGNSLEQTIINGVRNYVTSTGKEGTVTAE